MAGQKMDIEKKKVAGKACPVFRVSFPHLFEPHAFKDQKPKYSLTMLFDKKTDIKELRRAAHNAAIEKWGPKEKWPKNLRMPFRDGNEKEDLQGYEDTIFVGASSKKRIPVLASRKDADTGQFPALETDDEFYAGCYARATLIAFAYDQMGNRGVSFALRSVQKVKDGEQFGGSSANDDFDDVDDGSENEDSYSDSSSDNDEDLGY